MIEVLTHHTLLLYDDDDEFVDRASSYLQSAGDDGEVGLAVLSPPKWAMLREALSDPSRVAFLDDETIYTRPEAVLAFYDEFVRGVEREGGQVVRVIGDPPAHVTPAEREAWVRYEAVLNPAFANHPVSMLCVYDVRAHPESTLDAMWRTHPQVLADTWQDNPRFEPPARVLNAITPPPEPIDGLVELPIGPDTDAATERLRQELTALRVPRDRAANLLLSAEELLGNASVHGGEPRSQRVGRVNGCIVWEVCDNGPGFEDPLAGYLPPALGGEKTNGLWNVRQRSERLEFFRSPHGFTARVWV